MKQNWRWTCSFPSIGNARNLTYRNENFIISIESETIFNSDFNDVETSRWSRLPCHLKAKNAPLKKIPGRPPLSIMYVKHARATAKLKLNGLKQVCQGDEWRKPCKTRQGDEWRKPCISYQTCQADLYLSIYLSIRPVYLFICLSVRTSAIYLFIYLFI